MNLWPSLLQGKLCFVLRHLADLAATGHPHETGCPHPSPRRQHRQPHLRTAAPLGPYNLGCTSKSPPTRTPIQMLTPGRGYFQNEQRVAALLCAASDARLLLNSPRLNSLSGLVPLAPAPGCLLLALQACLYVLAVAELWGGQISPSWRPSKGLVAETLGKNPKARQ